MTEDDGWTTVAKTKKENRALAKKVTAVKKDKYEDTKSACVEKEKDATSDRGAPLVTMEDGGVRLQQAVGSVDMTSVVGPYAPLRAWHEDPVLPSARELRMELDNAFPIGIFLSLQKAQRPGMKQSYFRAQEMPPFYQNRSYLPLHWGQRKLLLSEVMFLTFALPNLEDERLLVYAGAAHGSHILYLVKLFPRLYFDCYDPAAFCPKLVAYSKTPGAHVRLFTNENGWFDEKVAKKYLPGGEHYEFHNVAKRKLLFVSDIRDVKDPHVGHNKQSSMIKSGEFMHKAKDEMKMQSEWTKLMKAELTMLKFKLPYPAEGGPAFEEYLRGDVYFQCWAPTPSSETRLLVYKEQLELDDGMAVWNLPYYTGKIDYFNAALRTSDFSSLPLRDIGITGPPRPPPPDFFRTVFNSSPPSSSSSSSSSSAPCSPSVDSPAVDSSTLADVWKGVGLKMLTADAFIETLIWANYIRDLEKLPVTVERLRAKIVDATRVVGGPNEDIATVFNANLNFQRKTENATVYGAEVSTEFVKDIQEYAKHHTPVTSWEGLPNKLKAPVKGKIRAR